MRNSECTQAREKGFVVAGCVVRHTGRMSVKEPVTSSFLLAATFIVAIRIHETISCRGHTNANTCRKNVTEITGCTANDINMRTTYCVFCPLHREQEGHAPFDPILTHERGLLLQAKSCCEGATRQCKKLMSECCRFCDLESGSARISLGSMLRCWRG